MIFTKSEFSVFIDALREQHDYDIERQKILSDLYGSDVMLSDNSRLTNAIFKGLHAQFPPINGFCEIQHFCYVLDFGRKSIELINVDILWNKLIGVNVNYILK